MKHTDQVVCGNTCIREKKKRSDLKTRDEGKEEQFYCQPLGQERDDS